MAAAGPAAQAIGKYGMSRGAGHAHAAVFFPKVCAVSHEYGPAAVSGGGKAKAA